MLYDLRKNYIMFEIMVKFIIWEVLLYYRREEIVIVKVYMIKDWIRMIGEYFLWFMLVYY